ncbi:hypothetical protein ACWKSP_26665 [Micromonosporaceae bacterium Da 78-11]
MNPQPSRYRIHVYKKNTEVFYDQRIAAVLDFSNGPGLRATQGQLDGLVMSLAWAAGARDEDTLNYRLAIHDWDNDRLQMDWPATTWHTATP